jgi:pimeloyl-ACP methyl ester carboxylesterase
MASSLHSDQRRGTRPGTLVFIHGNSSSMQVFDPIFAAPDFPYSLLRFDLPGHGKSPRSQNAADYAYPETCRMLIALLGELDDDLLLVGNSLGGHLAIDIASSLPSVKGLVVFGAAPIKKPLNPQEAFNPVPELQLMFQEQVGPAEVEALLQRACRAGFDYSALKKDFLAADGRVRSTLGQDLMTGNFPDEVVGLRALSIPKYFLLPDGDPTPNADYIRSLDVGAKYIDLSDCGHYPSCENPAAFQQAITAIAEEVFGSTDRL